MAYRENLDERRGINSTKKRPSKPTEEIPTEIPVKSTEVSANEAKPTARKKVKKES